MTYRFKEGEAKGRENKILSLKHMKRVFTDLPISPFIFTTNNITYYFSTQLHKVKFMENYENNRKLVEQNLTKRYKIPVKYDILADMYLYYTIETRGFYIVNQITGDEYRWAGEVILNGGRKIARKLKV